jgi:hypothetical protein
MIADPVNSGSPIIKGFNKMALCFNKGWCQRPQINIKLFEKHLQIYRKSNRMCFMTETILE